MGIEQSDNQEYFDNKKKKLEKEKSQEFFEAQKLKLETTSLLQSLAQDISLKFWIDIKEVTRLIENKTTSSLEELQASLWNNNILNAWDLLKAINGAKNQIEDLSKNRRDQLKQSILRDVYEPDEHTYNISQKFLSKNFKDRINHPSTIADNVFWAWIGVIDSSEAVIFFLYNLGKWIILTPYHIYLASTWKAKIDI